MTDEANQPGGPLVSVTDAPDTEEEARLRRQRVLNLLRGRWHWALLLAVIGGAAAAYAGYQSVEPAYQAHGEVRIKPELPFVIRPTEDTRPPAYFDSYLDAQADYIRSPDVILQAMREEVWQKAGGPDDPSYAPTFLRKLRVERSGQTITIFFNDNDRQVAVAGVRAVIDAYRTLFSRQESAEDAETLRKAQDVANAQRREIENLRSQRMALLRGYGMDGLNQRMEHLLERHWQLEVQLQQVRSVLEAMASGTDNRLDRSLSEIAASNPQMQALLAERQQIENEIARARQLGIGEQHRQMRLLRAELDTLNRQIERYVQDFRQLPAGATPPAGMRAGVGAAPVLAGTPEELRQREQELLQVKEQIEAELAALGTRQAQINDLDQRIANAEALLHEAEMRIHRLNTEPSGAQRLQVSYGMAPTEPYNLGKRKQLTLLGGFGGAATGAGLVMLVGLLDRRFRRFDEAEVLLPKVRMLGILPTLPEDLSDPERVAVAAHCVHHIRTLLQIGGKQGQGQVLVVTSPAPGSGKTSLTSALGLSFGSSGMRTLLIDADIVGGGLSRRLGATVRQPLEHVLRRNGLVSEQALREAREVAKTSRRPLADVLVELGHVSREDLDRARQQANESNAGLLDACDGESLEACVAETGIDNVWVLPLGGAEPNQAGALSPAGIRRLFKQARAQYDTILVDTGPVLGSIEAPLVAAEADGTLLVVSRGDAKGAVTRALRELQSINAGLAGLVFNHATPDDVDRSAYASMHSGPARHSATLPAAGAIDPSTTARLGPVGSAVASCSRLGRSGQAARHHGAGRNGRHPARPADTDTETQEDDAAASHESQSEALDELRRIQERG